MPNPIAAAALIALNIALLLDSPAQAHWCSNIFVTQSRFVVKPEKTTVYVGTTPATLRVYLQNNFPYKLFGVAMRGVATDYSITVSPSKQDVHPGQNVTFTYTIRRNSGGAGDVAASQLGLQVKFRLGDWRTSTDSLVRATPDQAYLISKAADYQSGTLNLAAMADRFANVSLGNGAPFFGRTGLEQLIQMFGYRFCFNASGSWVCYSEDCPAPCKEGSAWSNINQFPQNCLRAGAELAARKSKLGSRLDAARRAAVNAIKGGGSGEHKCMAAVVGGYLWQGSASPNDFTGALQAAANNVSRICQEAGLRAFDGANAQSNPGCTSGTHYESAACAAAEGLRGNDGPVKGILMPNAGDGQSTDTGGDTWTIGLYYAYMLYIVQAHRKDATGYASFYPDAGGGTTPPPPDAAVVPPKDAAVIPPKDAAVVPPKDAAVIPPKDAAVKPKDAAVKPRDGSTPTVDSQLPGDATASDMPLQLDSAMGGDSILPADTDGPWGIDSDGGNGGKSLAGGCEYAADPGPCAGGLMLLSLLLLGLFSRRRHR